jgi:hypothetical protein
MQSRITLILVVLNSFIKKRFTAKSKDLISDCFKLQASDPYISIGRHLLVTSCKTTSSEALLPILPKIAFKEFRQLGILQRTVLAVRTAGCTSSVP